MASSRIIVRRRRQIFMAHICSECGFPMITKVQIEAEAQKCYQFSESKAEKIAIETAVNALDDEIKRIESCWDTKQLFVGEQKGRGMIAPGHFCTSSVSGFDSHCPKCFNIEPWKSISSKKKMGELKKVNFPIVLRIADEAEEWGIANVRKLIDNIESTRKDPLAIERAIEEVKGYKTKIKILDYQINSFSEIAVLEQLKEELVVVKTQKSKLGFFNFKTKSIVNKKIKILELQIKDLADVLYKKQTPIKEENIKLENELLKSQAIAFGCTDDILKIDNGGVISYFFSPNKIPTDIMDEIEKRIAEEQNDEQIVCPAVTKTDLEPTYNGEVVYCRKCGFKLLHGSTFCTKCGTKVG